MMPQKKNLTFCEHQRYDLAQALGLYTELASGAHAVPFGDTMDVMFVWRSVLRVPSIGVRSCRRMIQILQNVMVKPERMHQLAAEGFSTASELANILLRDKGLAWREAHAVVATAVRQLAETGRTAADLNARQVNAAAQSVLGKSLNLTDAELLAARDPAAFIRCHTSRGGVAPKEVRRMIRARQKTLARAGTRHQARRTRLEDATRRLDKETAALLKGRKKAKGS